MPVSRHAATTLRASSTCASRKLAAAAAVVQHPDEIDDGVASAHEPYERLRVVHVGGDDIRGRQKNQLLGALAVARGHS